MADQGIFLPEALTYPENYYDIAQTMRPGVPACFSQALSLLQSWRLAAGRRSCDCFQCQGCAALRCTSRGLQDLGQKQDTESC